MKIYFSHGKESGPWGTKIKRLAAVAKKQGYEVDSIDYSESMDPDHRVELLISTLRDEEDIVLLVGSSMGGYVSLVASEIVNAKGLFLLAPALYLDGYNKQEYSCRGRHVEVVHGWSDEIIPPDNSIRFSKDSGCLLHLIPGDHRLNASMNTVEPLFRQFLKAAS